MTEITQLNFGSASKNARLGAKVARGKRCLLGQCRGSTRSTRPVHARAICRRCVRRAGLRTSLANCVRSDARRRQSKSCFRRLSDIDIAHRLEILMRYVCTALHGLSVAYATQELKKTGYAYPTTCGLPQCAPIVRSEHGEPCGWVAELLSVSAACASSASASVGTR